MERDDLSLLSAMADKERAKWNAKGISTITQLSYGYRPRRRKRTRPDADRSAKPARRAAPVVKNDHQLKALAIKKNQIHIVGAPSLRFDGTPIFLDVEGMSDRDFYYLIGLRYECGCEQVERSFWADGLDDERVIWESCLRELKAIPNVQIVTYGAYERRFLRHMKERYVSATDEMQFVDHLIETAVNLVGCIYGKIYFPTFSNSLKEIGRYLAFEWTWPMASGAAAPLVRRAWELGADDGLKRELIRYNMDDCRAAEIVAGAITRICDDGASSLNGVDVNSLARSASSGLMANSTAPCQSLRKSTTRHTGTIRGQKCTREPTRRFGGASGSRNAGAKVQRLIRRSRSAKSLKDAPNALRQGSDRGVTDHKSFMT
jgi:predicted RecB family nuclease